MKVRNCAINTRWTRPNNFVDFADEWFIMDTQVSIYPCDHRVLLEAVTLMNELQLLIKRRMIKWCDLEEIPMSLLLHLCKTILLPFLYRHPLPCAGSRFTDSLLRGKSICDISRCSRVKNCVIVPRIAGIWFAAVPWNQIPANDGGFLYSKAAIFTNNSLRKCRTNHFVAGWE